ncbi:unnamed protein product [Rodentolepis nana]|uniref:CAF1C_H4-bd domain-containing protein n=1 Tax=Rodentolepis nana TaxID=102285 RepID=A0A0R3TME9_RODNA|nr:unnamed protein product [Rodentolepis nana]
MDAPTFYSESKRKKRDEPFSDDSEEAISSDDTLSPEGTDGIEYNESSDESEFDGEISDVNINEIETQAIESPAMQSVWHSTTSNERKFSLSGKEELSIAPNPSYEGKIWPIDMYSLF